MNEESSDIFASWSCIDCGNESVLNVYNAVWHAISTDSTEIYLNFDHSWIYQVQSHIAAIRITRINWHSLLRGIILDDLMYQGGINDTIHNDVAVSIPTLADLQANYSSLEFIDTFLGRNPCWMPLREPFETKGSHFGTDVKLQLSSIAYRQIAVFIRLPSIPYHPTCQLYKAITRNQYPNVCPSKDSQDLLRGYLGIMN